MKPFLTMLALGLLFLFAPDIIRGIVAWSLPVTSSQAARDAAIAAAIQRAITPKE